MSNIKGSLLIPVLITRTNKPDLSLSPYYIDPYFHINNSSLLYNAI